MATQQLSVESELKHYLCVNANFASFKHFELVSFSVPESFQHLTVKATPAVIALL